MNGCVLHRGALNSAGYPVEWDGTRTVYTRRVQFECANGPLKGRRVVSVCGDKRCVNPDHLRAVPARDQAAYAGRCRWLPSSR